MPRACIIVLDSVGIGGAPDAGDYGDFGADTVGHIAERCATGLVRAGRTGPLRVPNMIALGLGAACKLATGRTPPGLEADQKPSALFGCARELSRGKDTITGHWEIAGAPLSQPWALFPDAQPAFPAVLIARLCSDAGLPGVLGNCHASGTQIIEELGEEHVRTGMPICYTSADSVFQVAAHVEHFGLSRLYDVCEIAKRLTAPLRIGRVIARPFTGSAARGFTRTANRRDFADPPPAPTLLDVTTSNGRDVVSIGKTADIFAHSGTGRAFKGKGNSANVDRLLAELPSLADGGLAFVNLVDFDSEYGHRRDVAGYAAALEDFDATLPSLLAKLKADDLLVLTADHGCDPTWSGTDHTREQVPVLAFSSWLAPRPIGRLEGYANIGASVAKHLGLPPLAAGVPFL